MPLGDIDARMRIFAWKMAADTGADIQLVPSKNHSNDATEESLLGCQVLHRKMRKSRLIGRRRVVSVEDDARRRAARSFLLGIKLNSESMGASITPAAMLEPLASPAAQPTIAIQSEHTTPRLPSSALRSGRDDPPMLRHGSLRRHSAVGHPTHPQLPATARSPFKASVSLEQYESSDYHAELPLRTEERKKLLRTASLTPHHRSADVFLASGQNYVMVQGTPAALFTVLAFRKDSDRHGRQKLHTSISSMDMLDGINLESENETSLGQLFDPVWSTVASPDAHHLSELTSKHLDNWLQQVHQYWRDKHGTLNVIKNYHPDLLDNEEVFYGRTAKTLNFSLYLVSVIEYRKAEDEKKHLNQRFKDVFPHIQLTLSKIRSIKREMKQVCSVRQLDDVVLCCAYVYFEKVILMGKANKANRKPVAGASLLLAAKFLDVERSQIRKLIQDIVNVMKVPSKEVLATELPLLVALQFSLIVPWHQLSRHRERLGNTDL